MPHVLMVATQAPYTAPSVLVNALIHADFIGSYPTGEP
jgi:hypothetical protein